MENRNSEAHLDSRAATLLQNAIQENSPEHVGSLLELYRNYLNLLAQIQINRKVRVRVDASDIVQDTLLEANRAFSTFRGTTEGELTCWLRKILIRNILDQVKMQTAQKRDVKRVQSLEAAMDRSSEILQNALFTEGSSPSTRLQKREQAVLVADALAKLPTSQREVILMRQLQQLSFSQIAEKLEKSNAAVRMIWLRGLEKLRQHMHIESNE